MAWASGLLTDSLFQSPASIFHIWKLVFYPWKRSPVKQKCQIPQNLDPKLAPPITGYVTWAQYIYLLCASVSPFIKSDKTGNLLPVGCFEDSVNLCKIFSTVSCMYMCSMCVGLYNSLFGLFLTFLSHEPCQAWDRLCVHEFSLCTFLLSLKSLPLRTSAFFSKSLLGYLHSDFYQPLFGFLNLVVLIII